MSEINKPNISSSKNIYRPVNLAEPIKKSMNDSHPENVELIGGVICGRLPINHTDETENNALILACSLGLANIVRKLILMGIPIDAINIEGKTALLIACRSGNEKIVKILIDAGADLDICDNEGRTPLSTVIVMGNTEIARMLISAGCCFYFTKNKKIENINVYFSGKFIEKIKSINALTLAVHFRNQEIIKLLVEWKHDLNMLDNNGLTPLMIASVHGSTDIANILVGAGAELNIQNKVGNTALIIASSYGFIDIVTTFVSAGAGLNIKNFVGNTALIGASMYGKVDVARVLVAGGADKDIKNFTGNTALVFACHNERIDMVRYLIDAGADLDIPTNRNISALFVSIATDQTEMAEMLIIGGCRLDLTTSEGNYDLELASSGNKLIETIKFYNALILATLLNNIKIVKLLVEKGHPLNSKNESGNTALMFASRFGYTEIVEILAGKKECDRDVMNNNNMTALSLALVNQNIEIVDMLIC